MKNILFSLIFLISLPFAANAEDEDIVISKEWARPILIAGRPGGAYFLIENKGNEDDKLISLSSSISPRVEMHEHTMKDGVMKMSKVEAIEVSAGGSTELKPGGYHIMLFDTANKYGVGDEIDLKLNFEKSGTIDATVKVLAKQP
ncbi:MAG: copper chaperone PCu(A)C [Kordiimonadaceae bacterium]|jgi:periplasmic copper chaperone A|nr:copper chaperone PCu(A)C [Kordiimonadaceae bacterium]MBT6032061.1 copper chaperone PCu(A)C [Kordiimonadaceae bacterium]